MFFGIRIFFYHSVFQRIMDCLSLYIREVVFYRKLCFHILIVFKHIGKQLMIGFIDDVTIE